MISKRQPRGFALIELSVCTLVFALLFLASLKLFSWARVLHFESEKLLIRQQILSSSSLQIENQRAYPPSMSVTQPSSPDYEVMLGQQTPHLPNSGYTDIVIEINNQSGERNAQRAITIKTSKPDLWQDIQYLNYPR